MFLLAFVIIAIIALRTLTAAMRVQHDIQCEVERKRLDREEFFKKIDDGLFKVD